MNILYRRSLLRCRAETNVSGSSLQGARKQIDANQLRGRVIVPTTLFSASKKQEFNTED